MYYEDEEDKSLEESSRLIAINKRSNKIIEESRPSSYRDRKSSKDQIGRQKSVSRILNDLKKVKQTGWGGVGLTNESVSMDRTSEPKKEVFYIEK